MDLNNLFTDDNAVSPVIGVILMVAITVILAAVIGAFVLDLGGNQEQTPQATWGYDFTENSTADDNVTIDISHDGGDDIDAETIDVSVGGTTVYESGADAGSYVASSSSSSWTSPGTVTAGETLTITNATETGTNFADGDEVNIIWTSSSGDSSSVISEEEINL